MGVRAFMNMWMRSNIFLFKKIDGAAYFVLYLFAPTAITILSLLSLSDDNMSGLYCYLTILVSALNCIYDAGNRWDKDQKNYKNTKLFLIILSAGIVFAYCFLLILDALIRRQGLHRHDWILASYMVGVMVSILDVIACFSKEMAWKPCVESVLPEEGL